jgi:putative metalloprotease
MRALTRYFLFLLVLTLLLFSSGCDDSSIDLHLAADAGLDAVKAVVLSDESVRSMARESAAFLDTKNRIAPPDSPYSRRLERLAGPYRLYDGHRFNFQVYLTPEINAFALADGSIRIYSGLMDRMNDEELLFIIGHEMGHVIKKHSRKKIRLAYASRAIRKGVASLDNSAGLIARSGLGAFAERLLNAQYSQKEEQEADDYGLLFLKNSGHSPWAAVSALMKLNDSAAAHTFLSTHPAPEKRAKRLAAQIEHTG